MQGVSSWMLVSLWFSVGLLCLSGGQPNSSEERRDYYDTLGVQRTATDRQVKKAFHKLAMTYHPDKNKSSDAEKIFREIAEAYEVLSNKEKRRRYDELGHKAFLNTEDDYVHPEAEDVTSFFHSSFDDLFQGFNLDDDPFLEEPGTYWSFQLGAGDEDDPFEEETDLFDLLGGSHYGYGEGQQFCWKTKGADGSTVEVCEGN